MIRPIIGITVDNRENSARSGQYESAIAYSRAVAAVGGLPMLLGHEPALAEQYVARCAGLILTGGVDPDPSRFPGGQPMHPEARPMDPRRQGFEMALLRAVDEAGAASGHCGDAEQNRTSGAAICDWKAPITDSPTDRPNPPEPLNPTNSPNPANPPSPPPACLGVCLGMQLMALHAGGRLNQFLVETHESAAMHEANRAHALVLEAEDSELGWVIGRDARGHGGGHARERLTVISSHRQAVADSGPMRVIARAPDGVIEAIDRPGASGGPEGASADQGDSAFYLGVQWHPERGGDGPLSLGLIRRFVQAATRVTRLRAN